MGGTTSSHTSVVGTIMKQCNIRTQAISVLTAAFGFGLLSTASLAETLPRIDENSSLPLIGNLHLPSVTPEEARRQMTDRVAPQASQAPLPKASPGQPVKLDLDVGPEHDLPTSPDTPLGFKRVDFAIAKPLARQPEDPGGKVVVAPRAPDSHITQEEPPVIDRR